MKGAQTMIKIVRGIYGYWDGHMVVAKTDKDEPFNETPEQESRLVNLGVAVYVNEPAEVISEMENTNHNSHSLEDMTLKELKEFAEPYGVKYKVGTNKADFIKAIKQAIDNLSNSEAETVDGEEELPLFDAAEAVL